MEALDLEYIASRLQALEETIIFAVLERIQFRHNPTCYRPGKSGFPDRDDKSLFDLRLIVHEQMDSRFGRYLFPEERPVNVGLPGAERAIPEARFPLAIDDFNRINLSREISEGYLAFLPGVCEPGQDGQYGSCIERDLIALQAMIRRVHYAAFYVAESKFRAEPEIYSELISRRDRTALMQRLTRPEVEERILDRVAEKSGRLQEISDFSLRKMLDPKEITELYRRLIIPLTKEGEVAYLLARG